MNAMGIMNAMEIDRLGDALRERRFRLDCHEMEVQQRTSSEVRPLRGPGFIEQVHDGRLLFKMYADGELSPRLHDSTLPGDIVPEDKRFRLRATDGDGREWTCGVVDPHCDSSHDGRRRGRSILSGELWQVECEDNSSRPYTTDTLRLDVLDDVTLPLNKFTETTEQSTWRQTKSSTRNRAEVKVSGCHLHFEKNPGILRIEAVGSPLPPSVEWRIVEALQFVLAKPIWWTLLHGDSGARRVLKIRSQMPVSKNTRLVPPLQFPGQTDFTGDVWPLFSKYLEYILPCVAEEWHPLSLHLHSVCEASAGSVDAHRLALGVAVEGILRIAYPGHGEHDEKFVQALEEFRCYVSKWPGLTGWEGEETFRKRLDGLLGLMGSVSAKDRLLELAHQGVVDTEGIAAWQELRHRAAHADRSDSAPLQTVLDLIGRVTGLMYKLVFNAIGYRGKRSDYATRGWPVVDYPAK